MKKQIQCPECNGFKVSEVSQKKVAQKLGAVSLIFGMATAIMLIGLPFLFIGLCLLVISLVLPDSGKMHCQSCGYIFYQIVTK